ncbi:MAG: radical SAM protein [Lachnospiraceae bacterium]|nr:radical SAM protein [Lachnospiraceae bacterium]
MEEQFDIQGYLAKNVEKLVRDAVKATFRNPRESAFMAKFAAASAKATNKRLREEKEGLHVPPFLIASITSSCNLHCAGCYSRHNHATVDTEPVAQLTGDEWLRIFREADDLGVSFILLAGGEPMFRKDIIEVAGTMQNILFPIFTNGTFMNEKSFAMFDKCRNLLPVMSIEGGKEETDIRRGQGVYEKLIGNMEKLNEKGLIFGASVTVTKENLEEAMSDGFLDTLSQRGCKAVIFVEFVPVTDDSRHLAPDDGDRAYIEARMQELRKEREDMIFIAFPGDEKGTGGCLAAGRGFFHINSHGGAEPCPFSAYSDINVKDTSLKDAIRSRLFETLKAEHLLEEDHAGGCVLFEKREQVERIVDELALAQR